MTNTGIKLSADFKKQTGKAITAIIIFAFTYLIVLILALGLTALCIYAGIMIIAVRPMIITVLLGIGVASLGVLILIFLIKFIFASHKTDRSHLIEITAEEEPALFRMIDDIVKEVKTSFPKKVYLSSDVNAAVFYDSSFWSMFFPIRKNLQIGVGLVNTVNQSELKAILSHEFGHFSQRTMKVGSYVYNVNQVMYNMLYENDSYGKLIQGWANVSGYISIFVILATKIISGIQWLLRWLYDFVNKAYMGLSREMEFHADEIAAHITGYEPLKSSLLRLNMADTALNSVFSFYNEKVVTNQKSNNVYLEQSFVLNFLAEKNKIPIVHQLPAVTIDEINKFNKSKLIIKNQWASHPSLEERITRLEETKLVATHIDIEPAGAMFTNFQDTQKRLSEQLFSHVTYEETATPLPFQQFTMDYRSRYAENQFSELYNGYYDYKNPVPFDPSAHSHNPTPHTIQSLFSDEKVSEVHTYISLQNDIETLKQIVDKTLPVKTFDYDGIKYSKADSTTILANLEQELQKLGETIKQNDISIFQYFTSLDTTGELKNVYSRFFEADGKFDTRYGLYTKISAQLDFIQYALPVEQIRANLQQVADTESELKQSIDWLINNPDYQSAITKEIRASFDAYLSNEGVYFGIEEYNNTKLEILFTAINNYAAVLSRSYFLLKKSLLSYQENLLNNQTVTDLK